ncbi:ATP-dependent RNA helicase HrpA [Gordonia sp. CPCC 205333]|uniref:ATP-dependent RNA helicase HrpA n=1 Tax=Gordonia sp. CPCC 205333 TaxID=3140790 RepID=UPI003AF3D964
MPPSETVDDDAAISTPDIKAYRKALDALTIVDAHQLGRRLDTFSGRGRRDKSATRKRAKPPTWESLSVDLTKAQSRVARRVASVPTITYPDGLPVSAARDQISTAIAEHQVVVIAGETGSGKTTQLPKICLELGRGIRGSIGHTQPRRIAASSVATRIADETNTELGEAIGYSVRFADKTSADTLVKVMTDGILLREIANDPMLRAYDTLIIDEAHERSLNIDFILGFLKRLLPRRPDLKVIITSATIEPDRFARHFAVDGADDAVPILEVSGRAYPVDIRYRPWGEVGASAATGIGGSDAARRRERADFNLVDTDNDHADLDQIGAIDAAIGELWSARGGGRGDILIFLPTERDIRDTADALKHRASKGAEIVPLFARLSNAEQRRVFTPSDGRRIVLATNVAETSLTVPGIRYVIDTGTARVARYSTRTKVNRLPIESVSQASARQRAGRCGRVAPGICIRLYSEDDFDNRPEFTDPEILRTNLAGVILSMLSLRLGDIADFPFVQAPGERAIRDGVAVLHELGAIESPSATSGPPRLTRVGRELATLPVDPRLGRMLAEGHHLGCLDHILVIAAALSLPDVRERPAEHRQAADESHKRFDVPGSDFLAYLELWDYLNEQRDTLSSSKFRRTCEREFLHWVRIREWRDLHRQLTSIVADLKWSIQPTQRDADAIHRSILSGLLSNIAARNGDTREYTGARNTTLMIFPGSSLSKKSPPFLMAAEMLETSRLFAHTVARVDPLWAEKLAGNLVKRVYSEPHWSSKRGSTMAHERVTLYGVPLVASRRVTYTSIDPELCREMFIRHALVEGDWRTEHKFLAHNRALLDDAAAIEHRARRADITITDDQLYEFYDKRIPADVTSARHFDTWWRSARRADETLLDLTEADVVDSADAPVSPTDFPGAWAQGTLRLDLAYKFAPGDPDDGVSVVIPAALLDHVRPAGFDWSVPGMRAELATELVKSLPKSLRKSMAPASRFADAALARLKPRSEPLTKGLARELSAMTGLSIAASDFDIEAVPAHLRVNFRVIGADGATVSSGKSLPALQSRGGSPAKRTAAIFTTWTADSIGTIPFEKTETVAGQQVTRYPTLKVVDGGVTRTLATSSAQASRMLHTAVCALLAASLPALPVRITRTLDPAGTLALSQSPYATSELMLAECTTRAVLECVTTAMTANIRTAEQFDVLRKDVAGPVAEKALSVFDAVVDTLREVAPVRAEIDANAGSLAADDVADQMHNLIYPGFVASTALPHLKEMPRYLRGARTRLEQLSLAPDRDNAGIAIIDRVVEGWNQRLAQLPPGRRDAFNESATWLVEELRVGTFSQRLGTAYPVSEKRIRRAFEEFR